MKVVSLLFSAVLSVGVAQNVTDAPVTASPTPAPVTAAPTAAPTDAPSESPSESPTPAPSESPTVSPTNAPTLSPTLSPTTLMDYWDHLDLICRRRRKASQCNKVLFQEDIPPFGNATDKMCQWGGDKRCRFKPSPPEGYPTKAPTTYYDKWLEDQTECAALETKEACKNNQRCKFTRKGGCVAKGKVPKTPAPTSPPTEPMTDQERYEYLTELCSGPGANKKACGRVREGKAKVCRFDKKAKQCLAKMKEPSGGDGGSTPTPPPTDGGSTPTPPPTSEPSQTDKQKYAQHETLCKAANKKPGLCDSIEENDARICFYKGRKKKCEPKMKKP